jgi:hypothetical protein
MCERDPVADAFEDHPQIQHDIKLGTFICVCTKTSLFCRLAKFRTISDQFFFSKEAPRKMWANNGAAVAAWCVWRTAQYRAVTPRFVRAPSSSNYANQNHYFAKDQ